MVETILSHLHSDTPSLKACSLVCKSWTCPARLQFFSELITHPTGDAESPLQAAAMFPFVRRLHVDYQNKPWDALFPQLVELCRIRSLRLSNMVVYCWNSRAWSSPDDLSRVVTLRLEHVYFSGVTACAQFVCTFPYLETLSIGGTLGFDKDKLKPDLNALRPSPNLVTLELNFYDIEELLEWFLSLPVHPAFRSVCLHQIWLGELDAIGQFLVVLGDSLESFSFSTHFPNGALSF
jgi:hypothetical protein